MNMKWKIIKVVGAFVVIIGIIFWTTISTLPKSYSGTGLNFEVGGGAVVVTNSSDESIPAQFTQSGTRSFTLRSNIDGVSGNSTRLGTGSDALHWFEFELPSGTGEFTITRGDNVMFVASSPIELNATVNPMTEESSRNAIIAAIVAIAGLLFYSSTVIERSWIGVLRGKNSNSQDTEPTPVVAPNAQGRAARSFGDNRAETGD